VMCSIGSKGADDIKSHVGLVRMNFRNVVHNRTYFSANNLSIQREPC